MRHLVFNFHDFKWWRANMSLKNIPILWRVVSLLVLLGIAATGAGLSAISNLKTVASQYDELIRGPAGASVALARANRWVVGTNRSIYLALMSTTEEGNRAAEAEQKNAMNGVVSMFAHARQLMPQYAADIDRLKAEFDGLMSGVCGNVVKMANAATTAEANATAGAEMAKSCEPGFKSYITSLAAFVDRAVNEESTASTALNDVSRTAITYTYVVLFGSITAVLALAVFVVMTTLTSPLKVLVDAMAKMSKGDLAVVVQGADRKDEIGSVARTLEVFRSGLLETEQLRMEAQATEAQNAEKLRKARHQIADQFQAKMGALADAFGKSSHEVSEAARNLSATAEETARQAQAVSGAAEEASVNVQTVAASTEEMTASVREIASQVSRSASVANTAASEAARTESDVRALSEAATKIGEVVELINNIAGQTNLLALNATIEAARAGEAGKGFAVVASEVKQLAAQTAKATEEISSKINEIQQATNRTVGSIERIVNTVSDIQSISTMISAAIEEQGAATGEIASNTQLAARGTEQVSDNINGVGRAAEMTGAASTQLMGLSSNLSTQAVDLQREVSSFVQQLRAG